MGETEETTGDGEPPGRALLVLAQEAARAKDAARMVAALQASGYLDGLVRRLQGQWPRLPRDEVDACVAEAVDAAYDAVGRGRRVTQLGGWLWKVAYARAVDAWDRVRAHHAAPDDLADPRAPPLTVAERQASDDEAAARRAEAIRLARRLLPKVGHGQVLAVTELLIEAVEAGEPDLPVEVIADTLGITAAAARALTSRGLERLRRAARDEGIEPGAFSELTASGDGDDGLQLEKETD